MIISLFLVSQQDCEPKEKEQLQIEYLTNKFHGLSLFPKRAINEDYVKTIIKLFYYFSKDGSKYRIACKSKEAEDYLDSLSLPAFNILTVYGATYKEINRNQLPCTHHNRDDPSLKFSLNIVQDMKAFIDNLGLGRIEID